MWETKRTRNWSDAWLLKLREDQRTTKAEIAVIVSYVPPRYRNLELVDGVWITNPPTSLPGALILRHSLLELAIARKSFEGLQTKTEMIYQYLTGPGPRFC